MVAHQSEAAKPIAAQDLMKIYLRRFARSIAGWPLVGRPVRIGIAVIRSPNTLDGHVNLVASHQQLRHDANQTRTALEELRRSTREIADREQAQTRASLEELRRSTNEIGDREQAFFGEQLPQLLQTISDINNRLAQSEAHLGDLAKSLPVTLRTLTQDHQKLAHAQAQLQPSVSYLLGRVEFVRRELMFELRYGASAALHGKEAISVEPKIVATDKVAAARKSGLKLNIGCGHLPIDGYLNVDLRELPGIDIVAEADKLPFKAGDVQEIRSSHMLEHFPEEQLRRSLLPYYFRLLKNGGTLLSIVPDAEAMIREYSSGNYLYEDLREVIYGGQDYEGDFHFNMFTPASLSDLLREAGFENIDILARGRRNGRCFEFEISASKGLSAT